MMRNGSVPQTPASTGVLLDDGQDFAGHVHDDLVGVAVGHHAGQAAAAGHAEAAGVVDDDQVDAAGLGALGRMPVPAPPPTIGSAGRDLGAETLQTLVAA